MRILFIFFLGIFLQSCASHTLVITSDVPTRIEANGQTICQTTPCEIVKSCFSHGERTRLEAFPLDKSQGYNQEKDVSANCDMGSENSTPVYFEMASRQGIALEVNSLANEESQSKKEKELIFLKKMHEKGALTDDMYREQVKKILDN
jgi:hypothetical protein